MESLAKSYCHMPGGDVRKGLTFGHMLENSAQEFPDNIAIWFGDVKYTYRDFNEKVNRMAASLLDLGLVRGDRVGILFPDWPEYSIALYACARIGVVVSPMNPLYRKFEITTVLNHLEAKALFIADQWKDFSFVDLISQIHSDISHVKEVIVKGSTKKSWMLDFDDLVSDRVEPGNVNETLEKYLKDNPVEADDLMEIAYTSGTTGVPKGVVHTHNTRMLHSIGIAKRMKPLADDVWLNMTPLFHTTGNCVIQHTVFLTGGTLVVMGRYSAKAALKEIERCKATISAGVPTMYIDLMNLPEFKDTDVSSLRYCFFTGAPMPPEVAKRMVESFGCGILQGDGTTECGSNVLSRPDDPVEIIAESPGPPLEVGNEVKVVDTKTRRIVPVNNRGEIGHRGPTNFLGYYKNPEKTAESVDEAGWFYPGDIGTMDEYGNIRLVGRIKDIIVRGGENIYATDMEGVIYTHPKVKECQVVGLHDERLGERTVACVIPKDPSDALTRDELVEFLKDKASKYLIPDFVVMIEDFPRTGSGKVQKFRLKDFVAEKLKS
ncbi:MAG: acyl--CoA ligase [Desulfobacteraceae bacterium]|nr:acyl--CoA ligase [Desulfobacteraceae bacterium]